LGVSYHLDWRVTADGSPMDDRIVRAIDAIAADHQASATALMPSAVAALRAARASEPGSLEAAARAVCMAQPCMGSLWNAAAAALDPDPAALDRLAAQIERAPDAIARMAQSLITGSDEARPEPVRLVTWSASRPVAGFVARLATRADVRLACPEGRPALEGRTLATGLAAQGVRVNVFADGALATALPGATALVVGADALTGGYFVNKAGTGALVAAASAAGVPTYVLAGRDKGLGSALAALITLREGPSDEVWADAPDDVQVRNPYFERVGWETIAALVTDRGPVGPADVPELCAATARALVQDRLAALLSGFIPR
jgi:translation initiation factor 2B subunit (eIF-2B alpha/beta/delta family)